MTTKKFLRVTDIMELMDIAESTAYKRLCEHLIKN